MYTYNNSLELSATFLYNTIGVIQWRRNKASGYGCIRNLLLVWSLGISVCFNQFSEVIIKQENIF